MLTADTLPIYDSLGPQPKWVDPTKVDVQKLEAKVFEDDEDIEEEEEEDGDIPDTGEDEEEEDEEDEEHGY